MRKREEKRNNTRWTYVLIHLKNEILKKTEKLLKIRFLPNFGRMPKRKCVLAKEEKLRDYRRGIKEKRIEISG